MSELTEAQKERLFEFSEKHCDHEKLEGGCLYHIFESFFASELKRERQEFARELLEKGHGGGNWRRLIIQLAGFDQGNDDCACKSPFSPFSCPGHQQAAGSEDTHSETAKPIGASPDTSKAYRHLDQPDSTKKENS